jgi:hypothetical protein
MSNDETRGACRCTINSNVSVIAHDKFYKVCTLVNFSFLIVFLYLTLKQ